MDENFRRKSTDQVIGPESDVVASLMMALASKTDEGVGHYLYRLQPGGFVDALVLLCHPSMKWKGVVSGNSLSKEVVKLTTLQYDSVQWWEKMIDIIRDFWDNADKAMCALYEDADEVSLNCRMALANKKVIQF